MVPEKLSRPWVMFGARLTVFLNEPLATSRDVWEEAVGVPPDNDQNQPRQRVRVQTGSWHEGMLQLTISPSNIVWMATPALNAPLPSIDIDNWRVADKLPDFVALTRPWLSSLDLGIKRIGFGLHSLLPAEDRATAYQLLQPLVPSVVIEPEKTSDLLYQINRPVPSRILGAEVRLNRLMKWSGLFLGLAELQLSPSQISRANSVGNYYASLDNDINTPAERVEAFEKSELGVIYDELVELGWENLEAGEKP